MPDTETALVRCLPLDAAPDAETVLERFADRFGPGLVVASDDAGLRRRAEALGCTALAVPPADPAADDGPFPPGTLRALRALAEVPACRHADVLLLDRAVPPLPEAAFGPARERLRKDPGHHVLPVCPSEDHPCQFRSYFHILDIRAVHLFEKTTDNEAAEDTRTTLPFPCLLEAGPAGAGDLRRDTSVYPPAWRTDGPGPRFRFTGHGGAQLTLRTGTAPRGLVGAACGPEGEAAFPLILRQSDGTTVLRLAAGPAETGQYTAWLIPFTGDTLLRGAGMERLSADRSLPLPPVRGAHGFVVVLLEQTLHGGPFDFEMGLRGGPLFDTKIIWKSGAPYIRTENKRTGQLISGRQTFPEVVEPSGGFVLFAGRVLDGAPSIESLLADTRSVPQAGPAAERKPFPGTAPSDIPVRTTGPGREAPPPIREAAARTPGQTRFELAELDRVADILSSDPDDGNADPVFHYFFRLALELRFRERNSELFVADARNREARP